MKNYIKYTFAIAFVALVLSSCEEVADNPIPHIASPVLVEVETLGKYTPLDQVTLLTKISDLDKSGIMDNAVGIDTIPVSLASIQVLKDVDGSEETFFSPLSLNQGEATITADWADILPADAKPEDGLPIEFEYFETYENIPFRKTFKLDYSPTAFDTEFVADSISITFSYDLITVDKTGVNTVVERQVNDGEFTTILSPGEGASGGISFPINDYTLGDVITIRLTGTKGELISSELFTLTVE
ncbi:MAG: hypothetical protein WA958_04660 [Tunicatimonas sp.]